MDFQSPRLVRYHDSNGSEPDRPHHTFSIALVSSFFTSRCRKSMLATTWSFGVSWRGSFTSLIASSPTARFLDLFCLLDNVSAVIILLKPGNRESSKYPLRALSFFFVKMLIGNVPKPAIL